MYSDLALLLFESPKVETVSLEWAQHRGNATVAFVWIPMLYKTPEINQAYSIFQLAFMCWEQ